MTMDWIKQQAKWVIIFFGIFIVGGLLMMDQAGTYGSDRSHNSVGKVNSEEIPTDRFQKELQNYIRGQETENGKSPEGLQLAQIRDGLFNYKVQSILMQKIFETYQLHASREEMMDYVIKHPKEVAGHIARYDGYESMPPFLADSTLDQTTYENWLAQDSVYDRYSMRELEDQLRLTVIPQIQLQQIMKSQVHRTPLEAAFSISVRETKASLKFYSVSTDSFVVNADKFKDTDLKAYYEAHPDSFYFHDDAVRLAYVRIALQPSQADTALMRDFSKELKGRVAEGEKFSDLAKDYSNDAPSAENGGKLEGFRTRDGLEPAFADAAFALQPGEVSEPVLGQLGYNVIMVHNKQAAKADSAAKIEFSYILLKITVGTETVDSLMTVAEKMRTDAQNEGLEKVAGKKGIPLEKTQVFEKTNLSPLGGGYVQGTNSFAFSQFDSKEKISQPLQAEDALFLFERELKYEKGRNFERAKTQIASNLVKEEKLDLAKKELEAQKSAIALAPEGALPARIGKAVLDSTAAGPISADNWLAGFGYASPTLFKVFNQPNKTWGPVLASDLGAVMAMVIEKIVPSESEIAAKAQTQSATPDPYQVSGLFQDWVTQLPKTAKVENTMDMVFRD